MNCPKCKNNENTFTVVRKDEFKKVNDGLVKIIYLQCKKCKHVFPHTVNKITFSRKSWKDNYDIRRNHKQFIVILDDVGHIYWEPNGYGDNTYASPFPVNYIPQIGEIITLVDSTTIFKHKFEKDTYKVKSINSIIAKDNMQINLIVEKICK